MSETVSVQMDLFREVTEKVEKLEESSEAENRAQVVADAVEFLDTFSEAADDGGTIYVEYEDGTRKKVNSKYL